ncbi:MAG: endonuclease domain-containing protein [Patescibacteria group bacterium]
MSDKQVFNSSKLKETRRVLRNNQTDAEVVLWQYLRRKELGAIFYRQVGIGRYIVDFCCRSKKLVIELDGKIHLKKDIAEYDLIRSEDLKGLGFKILHFKNEEVLDNPEAVVKKIKENL